MECKRIMERLLNIEATSACYADCSMCPRDKVNVKGYVTMEVINSLIDKVKDYKLYEISISGRGEPTLHPKLVDIIKKLRKLNTRISVVTTTAGLNEDNYKQIIDVADILRISVSSIEKDIFKMVHRGLDYDKTWEMIEKVVDYKKDKINIHLVGGDVTFLGLDNTIKYFKEKGIDNIFLFPLWNRGGNLEERNILELRNQLIEKYKIYYSEDEYLDSDKAKLLQIDNYCPIGDTSISVNFAGDMIGCFQDFKNLTKVCSVFDNKDFITERTKQFCDMDVCKRCNSRKQVRIK